MTLTNYKLGKLIEQIDTRNADNKYTVESVKGISTGKSFIETKANLDGVSLTSYKIVGKSEFAYVSDTSRRGEKIAIAFNNEDDELLVSSIYTVFRVKREDLLLSDYLFIYFNRPEFDRYSRFNSWGSARETFDWEEMCDIDIELPPLHIQQKYVDIYNAMVLNQKSYERGLEDFKLIIEGHFDISKKGKTIELGKLIERVNNKNENNEFNKENVRGINNTKQFFNTKANLSGVDLSKFLIVDKGAFAYNSRTDGRDMLVLALNREEKPIIVTHNYNVFKIKQEKKDIINSEYLYAFFKRDEFDRLVRFNSWGTSQEQLSWDSLCSIKVPFPDINKQNSIAYISQVYLMRIRINESLKKQIMDMCPILIKGSKEEANRTKEA